MASLARQSGRAEESVTKSEEKQKARGQMRKEKKKKKGKWLLFHKKEKKQTDYGPETQENLSANLLLSNNTLLTFNLDIR